MSRNLERERSRDAAHRLLIEGRRAAWEAMVWDRTHNIGKGGSARNRDGGGKKSWGSNAVIIRPSKKTKKSLGGEPYGIGSGAGVKTRLPSKPYLENLLRRGRS